MDSFLKKSKNKKIKKAYSEYANGNLDQALALIEDEIKHKDGNVVDDAWVLLGKISFDRQDYNSASVFFDKAISVNKKSTTFYDLAVCLYYDNKYLDCIKSILFAILYEDKPGQLVEYKKTAIKMISEVNHRENSQISRVALYNLVNVFIKQSNYENNDIYALYLYIVSIMETSDILEVDNILNDIECILEQDRGGLDQIKHVAHMLIVESKGFIELQQRKTEEITLDDIVITLNTKIVYYYLEKFQMNSSSLELFLIQARKVVLDFILQGGECSDKLFFVISVISKQAWKCEYIFFYDDADINNLNKIKEINHSYYNLACFMFFERSQECIDKVCLDFDNNIHIKGMAEIINISQKIKLIDIDSYLQVNNDSVLVKEMYEENPYPRWTYNNYLTSKIPLIDILNNFCHNKKTQFFNNKRKPKVLIAGCGTGKQVVGFCKNTLYKEMIAIDISIHSLQYAKYMANQSKLKDIHFYQQDLLNLDQDCFGTFDYIECVGVLHHLKEPFRGWANLVDTLEPGGVIKIGLYSSIARSAINRFRQEYQNETDNYDIKKLYEIRLSMLNHKNSFYKKFLKWSDFYSASAFRDLVAHVQEEQFTLLKIKEMLIKLNLEFMGFHISKDLRSKFLTGFDNDESKLFDLDCWSEFETNNEDSFYGMYQFWCKK
ncbi:bifunctional 3-demethylubiquinone-9 3-methyltransferase/ 2-octaprenyl-6-hydroxy phenol methylase [Piscirickettsia salmonis]|uniref:class I SAM-dependent methyltransferase n=1 Tax=Piscirickettsia salmonis TaxID=1238 RepID=UPI0012B6F4E4|nr:class I SAM-dependent methyltransferase [Piscirickettsia salmonis]QGP49821.1 bifunctional 3-demethylubiquinone-9 3-methyltransferase/ 2-octaprenyl-6-hydroxy phenol methylase [Piscirickettsia salmonis]